MRILFLCYEFPPAGGGRRRALWHLCRHLADVEVAADVVTSRGDGRGTSRQGEATIHAVPTRRRSVHQTATEAMACGLPVVATRESGVRQYVEHGANGFLIAPRDAGALAAPLKRLIEDPDLRRRMGEASAERAREKFTWRVMARRFADLYRRHAGT